MRVLVTGAAGQLGQAMLGTLHAAGHEVRATDRMYKRGAQVEIDVADLCDQPTVYALLKGIDGVVHFGNYPNANDPDIERTYHRNVMANANVFHAAGQLGVHRMVFASSIQVIGGVPTGLVDAGRSTLNALPLDEQTPICPQKPYALGKLASEQMLAWCCERFGMTGFALRYPWLASESALSEWRNRPSGDPSGFPAAQWLNEGLSYLEVADAAELALRCLTAEGLIGYQHYLPAAPDNTRNVEPAEAIRRWYPNVPLKRDINRIDALIDTRRITEETGWKPRPRLSER